MAEEHLIGNFQKKSYPKIWKIILCFQNNLKIVNRSSLLRGICSIADQQILKLLLPL